MAEPEALVPLGETGWHVWRSAVLRAPGFAASGLDLLAAPDCAKHADAFLAGDLDRAGFEAAFTAATARSSGQLAAIAADPLFREAVTWQSLHSVEALDGLARTGPDTARNSRHRQREIVITRYWQRYCAKNDTIGFFGPVCWAALSDGGPAATVHAGPALTRAREVDLEWRALAAYAERLAEDTRYHPWLPVSRRPDLALDGDDLLQPGLSPQRLAPATAALLGACDGRTAREVAAAVLADPRAGFRKEADALLALAQLAEQGLVRRGIDLPLTIAAEDVLLHSLAALGEPELRDEALSGLSRLLAARDGLARAAGDADAVRAATLHLRDEFAAITGGEAVHRPGATYVGRGLAYEETVRDLDVTLGGPVLDLLAETLVPLLTAARWLTAAMAAAFESALRELHAEAGGGAVPLGDIWDAALGVIFGAGPVADVIDDFSARWSRVLRLDGRAGGDGGRIGLDPAEVTDAVAREFPAAAPGWRAARLHSPDLHLSAGSVAELAAGEFTAVLGELHVAWLTCDNGIFTRFHPEPGALRAAVHRDLGDRVVPLYPQDFPEFTARMAFTLNGPDDVRLAYTPAPVPPGAQVLPTAAVTVSVVDGELVGQAPDGRAWPLVELFGSFLSARSVNACKLVDARPYTPRVAVGRLVVQRETWRTTVGDCGVDAPRSGEAERYLAIRRWRERLGLPERVFVKVGTEIKPCYVDFTGPAYVAAFVALVRAAARDGGPDVPLTVSELLPAPEQAWVPDGAGRRYLSELRMTVRDPATAR
ncbi:lantibiotic dehydratase [Catellatospora bangladeshensis]|uniref:Lantibiotic dehydratase N-terminal domain-containing protein n=2 Tax=Catellatospora bangladeshensis TaxID=310355 RepID=A0A8J3JKV7_9ACTN|nr:lantibiotic dehydratase [Catellatospora bangladeshensis]GIF80775.1 hypothetical protein Cba03nite_21240 [Catellatospora bangladeshensis]